MGYHVALILVMSQAGARVIFSDKRRGNNLHAQPEELHGKAILQSEHEEAFENYNMIKFINVETGPQCENNWQKHVIKQY